MVASGGLTLVFLMDDFETGVFLGILVCDFARVVSRAVVDKEDFEILVGLGGDGIEALW